MTSNSVSDDQIMIDLPEGTHIVSIVNFNGHLYLATEQRVYRLYGDVFVPLMFQVDNQEMTF